MNSNDSEPIAALYTVRVCVGVCSCLSILGACAIVVSYAAFPELRTTARQLLLNVSITDIVISLALLLGLIQNANVVENPYTNNGSAPYWLCETQAFFIIFASDAAVLWTISIGVYFFVTIALQGPNKARQLLPAFYVFSWGVAFAVVLWLALTDSLGYEPKTDPAFCGILSTVEVNGKRVDADYPILAGYEAWKYFAFIVLPVLLVATLCQNKRIERIEKMQTEREMLTLVDEEASSNISSITSSNSSTQSSRYKIKLSQMADRRIVIVPVVYMVLQVWGIAADIGIYFLSTHAQTNYRENAVSSVLVFISAVGRALPGFVHGLLFCALTKEVRQTMVKGLWSGLTNCEICIYDRNCGTTCCCARTQKDSEPESMLDDKSKIPSSLDTADATSGHVNKMCNSFLAEYDIVSAPDPTSSVSIVQVPEIPRFSEHFPDDQ